MFVGNILQTSPTKHHTGQLGLGLGLNLGSKLRLAAPDIPHRTAPDVWCGPMRCFVRPFQTNIKYFHKVDKPS